MAFGNRHAFLVTMLISLVFLLVVAAVLGIWFAISTALLALGAPAIRAVLALRTNQRQAAKLWGFATLGHLAAVAVAGGLLFGAYIWAYSYTQSFCEPAGRAPTVAEREARLAEMDEMAWAKTLMENLTNKGEFVFDCDRQRYELDALARDGTCPTYLPEGIECRCGSDPHATASRCAPPEVAMCLYQGTGEQLTCRDP